MICGSEGETKLKSMGPTQLKSMGKKILSSCLEWQVRCQAESFYNSLQFLFVLFFVFLDTVSQVQILMFHARHNIDI